LPGNESNQGAVIVSFVRPFRALGYVTIAAVAFYAEVDYAIDGLKSHLSTQIRVAGMVAANGKQ
jgi:hypothetical protein